MSNIECAIEIMKKRGDIECYAYGLDSMPMLFKLESDSTKIATKFFKAMKEDDNYLVCTTTNPCRSMEFVKKEKFEQWLDDKCKEKEKVTIPWQSSHLDSVLEKHTGYKYEMKKKRHCDYMEITNLAEKEKREEKEKAKEQEAINLLDQIL